MNILQVHQEGGSTTDESSWSNSTSDDGGKTSGGGGSWWGRVGRKRSAGGSSDTAGEWRLRNLGSTGERTNTGGGGLVGSSSVVGVEDLVNDVDNAVVGQDVGSDNLCVVDIDGTVADVDGKLGTIDSSELLVVGEASGVSNGTLDNVVGEDGSESSIVEATKGGANCLEGRVGRSKNGHISETVDGVDQVGFGKGTSEGRETSLNGSVGDVGRKGQDRVNDMDSAASEVDIGCRDHGLGQETRVDVGLAINNSSTDALTTSDVGKRRCQ